MKTRRFPLVLSLLFVVVTAVSLSGCAAGSFLWYKSFPDYPKDETDTLEIPGLDQEVSVYFDEYGIAHIEAQNEKDLLRAIGFTQSRARFFAMDVMRRFARGRVSELVGVQKFMSSDTLEFDTSMRGWGIDKDCVEDVKQLDPEIRELSQAYVDGINYALEKYKPLEYRLLRVDPEPWTLEDTFAMGRLNAWSVTHNWHQEASRLVLALHGGAARSEKIYPSQFWPGGTSAPDQDVDATLLPAIVDEMREMLPPRPYKAWESKNETAARTLPGEIAQIMSASNAWVVAGDYSASGKPVLANDPHLSHFIPSMFLQQHLKAPGLDVIGATIAGVPYILSGHNGHVAWGITSAVGDAVDLYVEKVNPDNPDEILTPEGYKPIFKEEHVIRYLEDGEMKEKSVVIRKSPNGPIMNDFYPNMFPEWAPLVAIKWSSTGLGEGVANLGKANRAKTVEELREGMAGIVTPISMFNACDDQGNIAVFATGSIPERDSYLGTFPVPGWVDTYQWKGLRPPLEMPLATKNTGYFAHGNNLYRNPLHSERFFQIDSGPSYRVDRIHELLAQRKDHNRESLAKIQGDVKLLRAARLLPKMLEDLNACTELTPKEQSVLKILTDWDYEAKADSSATLVFYTLYREAYFAALRDEVDEKAFDFLVGQRYSTNAADLWYDDPNHVVWDHRGTAALETRKDVVVASFKKTVDDLTKSYGEDPTAWKWGEVHYLHVKHLFGSKEALADYVNLDRVPAAGGLDSVWKSHFDLGHPETPFKATAGPVYRMVVDLGDPKHGWFISDTGVSAWPGSPHYDDQHGKWLKEEFIPMLYDWDEIKAQAKAVLTLKKAE